MGPTGPWVISMGPQIQGPKETPGSVPRDGSLAGIRGPWAPIARSNPRLAALLDSDENFMLYRRFGYLQARLLLHKQRAPRTRNGSQRSRQN
jgi:hypothetical protein